MLRWVGRRVRRVLVVCLRMRVGCGRHVRRCGHRMRRVSIISWCRVVTRRIVRRPTSVRRVVASAASVHMASPATPSTCSSPSPVAIPILCRGVCWMLLGDSRRRRWRWWERKALGAHGCHPDTGPRQGFRTITVVINKPRKKSENDIFCMKFSSSITDSADHVVEVPDTRC